MKTQQLATHTIHRPWPIPQKPWQFYQEWNRAIFLHWKVEEALLRPFVPEEFEIDKLDGQAWISMVAFDMDRVRPRYIPSFPPISNFLELNVRTYIKHRGRATVYFLSLEANNKIACSLARSISELPYRYAKMTRNEYSFLSENEQKGDRFLCAYELGEESSKKSELDKWLTERYGLFHIGKKGVLSFDIHHVEWPMQNILLNQLDLNYSSYTNLIKGDPDLVQYSPGVQVLTWGKEGNP